VRRALALCATVVLGACSYDWSFPDGGGADAGAFTCDGGVFCDTFEESTLSLWDDTKVSSGGTVTIDAVQSAPTPTHALLASHDPLSSPPSSAYAEKTVGKLTSATLSFAIRPDSFDDGGNACVAGIIFVETGSDGGTTDHLTRLLVGKTGSNLQEEATPNTIVPHLFSQTTPIGTWTNVTLSVAIGGNITVTYGGQVVQQIPTNAAWVAGQTRIFVGINFLETPTTAPVSVHIDDVRLDGT
jgi:hypothetical protein